MAIQIGAKPDSGFNDPLGMLKDCHRRIERFLGILCLVVQRAKGRTLTEEERSAIQVALQYFRSGGQRHTADEELSLFPRLRACPVGPPRELELLETDHREAEQLHNSVERLYLQWVATGALSTEDRNQLLLETEKLRQLYAQHIEVEERIVFPHAAQFLDDPTIAAIGLEFETRRSESAKGYPPE